jgi:rare lipoprotein A
MSAQNQREIGSFSDKRKYGSASPRVVEYGQEVPKGGGRDHVGRPYRVAGRWYTPRENPAYTSVGHASWYGDAFHGRKTANGEVYDKYAYTAAHPTMPLPSYARVTNLSNNRSIIVRVNDRGPFHGGRIIDLSERVAHALEFKHIGTARVKVDYVQRASTAGSDDRKLVATLRTDGSLAQMPGSATPVPGLQPVMVASSTPVSASPRLATAASLPERTSVPAEQPKDDESESQATAVKIAEMKPVKRQMALPQDRPFDLGMIPGAGTPLAKVNNGQARPARAASPVAPAGGRQKVAEIYFAPVEGFNAVFGADNPLKALKPGAFDPIPLKPVSSAGARSAR